MWHNVWHYRCSKSQIFVQKFNFDKTPTFSRDFHPNIFLTIFLVKSKLSTAKKSKTTTFSQVFHPKKSTIFSGNQSWTFGRKMKISNSIFELSSKIVFLTHFRHIGGGRRQVSFGFSEWQSLGHAPSFTRRVQLRANSLSRPRSLSSQ